jgi:hypothetical protein
LREKLAKVEHEYDEYHSKNDLDRYFAEHLSKETRARVLKELAEFQKRDEQPEYDKDLMEDLTFSGCT